MVQYTPLPLEIEATFTPETDNTSLRSNGYISMDKIRFFDGAPETIGGWISVDFNNGATVSGIGRMLYSQMISGRGWLLIGTHLRLYANFGSDLTNITPLVTATTALANNPITTYFPTLGSNPLTTVNGSKTVTVTHASHRFVIGDRITIAGASTTNGIPNTELNAVHIIRSIVAGTSYTITVPTTAATSSGSGGGASVTVGSGLITVADTAHGFSNGDRVKLAAATNVGGIVAATHINLEHIIRNKSANAYDIMTQGVSTSGAAGGGAGVTRQGQIASGRASASIGVGYSAGQYGDGLYSAALQSSSLNTKPRIWSAGPYGDAIILTPGSQTGVYRWDASTATAPTAVTNAPTAVNYVFTDREFVITLGASGVKNRVKTSDRGASTVWTGTAQNEAFEDDVEGAGEFITHATVRGGNLLFTANEVYYMRYVGKPAVWEIKRKDSYSGIIAQNARVVVGDVCYYMGENGFFYTTDGVGIPLPLTKKVRKYVFDNINRTQQSKCFAEYRAKFSEVVFRYPSATGTEPDRYLRYNIEDGSIAVGTKERTAAEYPFALTDHPRMIDDDGVLYMHEYGVNADGSAMSWSLEGNYGYSARNVLAIHGLIPDSIQSADISVTCYVKDFPQSASADARTAASLTVSPSTTEAHFDEGIMRGSLRKYRWAGNTLNGSWRMGIWHELVKQSSKRV